MFLTMQRMLVLNVATESNEFWSAIAPISKAHDVRTVSVSLLCDIFYTKLTPFWTKWFSLRPFSLRAKIGSRVAKFPIQASRICLLH